MQTFLPFPSFRRSASVLDNKRLGKQRVETLQILQALIRGPVSLKCELCGVTKGINDDNPPGNHVWKEVKTAWFNHPAANMWRGAEFQLAAYGRVICFEWIKRGYNDTCYEKILNIQDKLTPSYVPYWMGSHDFHLSHQSNLIRKNPEFYKPIFGSDIPDNLPYVWPKGVTL